jgi:phage baseplate assembly protein W
MAVRLDNLKLTSIEEKSLESGYLYKDIKFDLEMTRFSKPELYSKPTLNDLDEIQDGQAVINSVKNILTTTPGEKLLNPTFGLDFRSYLFEPINTTTSYFLAQFIYSNLGVQEPRITLEGLSIEGFEDQSQYDIVINYSIPKLNIHGLSLNATLNKDGYVLV